MTNLFLHSLLLQLGVDINAKDNDGWTPLHAAVHWGQNDACEVLADHGANFSARNKMVTSINCQLTSQLEPGEGSTKLFSVSLWTVNKSTNQWLFYHHIVEH